MDPDRYMFDGTIEITPNFRIGYVSQFARLDQTKEITVFEYIADEFLKLQNEIASICTELETASDIDSLLEKYQLLWTLFMQSVGRISNTEFIRSLVWLT
jgi:ATP-binding cassette subfamily F protein 3